MRDLDEKFWREVGRKLRFAGKDWWERHRQEIVGLGTDEAREIFRLLKKGKRRAAKIELVGNMTPNEWAAYRDGTTAQLQGIADRRAKMLDALEELGWIAAQIIGRAALGVLGG